MTEPTDLDALARRFLDLWRGQIEASLADPTLAANLARLMATPFPAATGDHGGDATADTRGYAPAGAAPAGPASDPSDDRLAGLARRVAACEERLAALERRSGGKRGGA